MPNLQDWNIPLLLFLALFVARYTRLLIGIWANLTYKPKPLNSKPRFRASDVTVIIPTTFKKPGELIQCLRCISFCEPATILIVTAKANVELVKTCCALNSFTVEVLGVEKLNKRRQMVKALKHVETRMTVFADDDVFWPKQYLEYLLAVFEDERVGAGGTRQRTRRNGTPDFWNFLGISYLERRVFNNIATNAIDGSISTLSGRTSAYLTEILKSNDFFEYFVGDAWLGRPLNTDDDKALTRWVYGNGYKITIQSAAESIIETTLEGDRKYIDQCLRWARSHWRGNFTVMTNEWYWRSSIHWFGLYYIYIGQFQTPAVLVDVLLFLLLWKDASWEGPTPDHEIAWFGGWAEVPTWSWMAMLAGWIFFTKIVKLLPHFWRYPADLKFIPVSILFSYLHGIINIYALFTLHYTHWGSQNLQELAKVHATADETMPLLRDALVEGEGYHETRSPTGRVVESPEYFTIHEDRAARRAERIRQARRLSEPATEPDVENAQLHGPVGDVEIEVHA